MVSVFLARVALEKSNNKLEFGKLRTVLSFFLQILFFLISKNVILIAKHQRVTNTFIYKGKI